MFRWLTGSVNIRRGKYTRGNIQNQRQNVTRRDVPEVIKTFRSVDCAALPPSHYVSQFFLPFPKKRAAAREKNGCCQVIWSVKAWQKAQLVFWPGPRCLSSALPRSKCFPAFCSRGGSRRKSVRLLLLMTRLCKYFAMLEERRIFYTFLFIFHGRSSTGALKICLFQLCRKPERERNSGRFGRFQLRRYRDADTSSHSLSPSPLLCANWPGLLVWFFFGESETVSTLVFSLLLLTIRGKTENELGTHPKGL